MQQRSRTTPNRRAMAQQKSRLSSCCVHPILLFLVAASFRQVEVNGFVSNNNNSPSSTTTNRPTSSHQHQHQQQHQRQQVHPCQALQATVDPFADGAPNLYLVLGASPQDSDRDLKKKWQNLARKLHPDANINRAAAAAAASASSSIDISGSNSDAPPLPQEDDYPYDMSDINAAWGILSDPKERRKYDRELQAKSMADNFEALMDAGIKNAIPFLQRTAKSTQAAAKSSAAAWTDVSNKSSQVMEDVNKRVAAAAAIYDLDSEVRELELKAARSATKAKQLELQIKTQNDRRMEALVPTKKKNANHKDRSMTSADAARMLLQFNVTAAEQPATANEIAALEKLELLYKETNAIYQQTERQLVLASKQATDAVQAEERAAEKLKLAQQELAMTQAKNHDCQKGRFDAVQAETDALLKRAKSSKKVQQQTEQVRSYLRRNEDVSMEREAMALQLQRQEQEAVTLEVKQQAQAIKQKADELRVKAKQDEDDARNGRR